MSTQYIPAGERLGLAFQRLDESHRDLVRQIALSSLFSWNYQSRLWKRELVYAPAQRPGMVYSALELLAVCLAACIALCACGEPERDRSIPEIAGPCPGPGDLVQVLGVRRLRDGSSVIVLAK